MKTAKIKLLSIILCFVALAFMSVGVTSILSKDKTYAESNGALNNGINDELCEVIINGYVRTDASGNIDTQGMYLTTPNLTIIGFDEGDSSIKSVMIKVTDFVKMQFLSLTTMGGESVDIKQGSDLALEENNVATNSVVIINFANKVSMVEAQEYLRTQVVYQPTLSTAMSLEITVSDGEVSASAITKVSQNAVDAGSWTIVTTSPSTNTSTGYKNTWVYFAESEDGSAKTYTFDGRGTTGSLKNGIVISGTVYFYIPKGVTVYAYGAHAYYRTPGAAGIYLSSGNYLYIYGGGKIYAYGGNAGNGHDGYKGDDAYVVFQYDAAGNRFFAGDGGDGGEGGGGAGAGIGTNGGYGGYGGTGGQGGSVHWSSKSTAVAGRVVSEYGAGGKGTTAADFGALYNTGVTINAYGGSNGTSGGGAGACSKYTTLQGEGWSYKHACAGGGGGGGGGAGYSAYGIGTGGVGGGGGAGGVSGACHYGQNDTRICGGLGGKGGTGYYNGTAGTNAYIQKDNMGQVYSKDGGGIGTGSVSKSASSWGGSSFTIKLIGENEETVSSQNYLFNATNISVPDYSPAEGEVFLGWQVATYGLKAVEVENQPLTSAEQIIYQPGDTIDLSKFTYGNITLKPVTMSAIEGEQESDTLEIPNNVFISGTQPIVTYYTYTLKLTFDGEPYDFGQIKLVNTANENDVYKLTTSGNIGTYKIILTENTTFNVYVEGKKLLNVSVPSDFELESANEKTVNFNTLNVTVSGINPESVTLIGTNAPLLKEVESTDGEHKYSVYAQEGVDTSIYQIKVDNYTVPLDEAEASYGKTANVLFPHVTATVNTNTTINNVELRSASQTIPFTKNGTGWELSSLIDSKTVYNVYVNGVDCGKQVTLNQAEISVELKYYTIEIETKVDGVTNDVANVKIGGKDAVKLSKGKWQAVVVANTPVTVTLGEEDVATVTPSDTLGVTYVNCYTVTLNTQGGNGGSDSVIAPFGINMPSATMPTRTGYTFGGYYTGTNGTGTEYYDANGASTKAWDIANSTTLYAKWTVNSYTITLDSQNGNGGSASVVAPFDINMPSVTVPTRTGYTFGGYYTGTNGTGTEYYDANGASTKAWDIANSTTLYAKWTEHTATLNYDANGHGTAPNAVIMKYSEETLTADAITCEGYTFVGWNTNENGTGTTYGANEVFKDVNVEPIDTTLYAIWTPNPTFAGISLTLDSDIYINFYMELPSEALDNEDMVFTVGDKSIEAERKTNKNGTYFTCSVNVLEIATTVKATYTFEEKDYELEYSVKAYVEKILNEKDGEGNFVYNDATRTLAYKISNYGYHTQKYLENIHKNVTIGENGYTAMNYYTDYDVNLENAKSNLKDNFVTPVATSDYSLYGRTVSFDSASALNYYVKVLNGTELTADKVNCEGKEVEVKLYKNNIYIVTIKDIKTKELAKNYTVTIMGEESLTITGSILDYCGAIVNSHASGTAEKDILAVNSMASIYEYHLAAIAYANSKK